MQMKCRFEKNDKDALDRAQNESVVLKMLNEERTLLVALQ